MHFLWIITLYKEDVMAFCREFTMLSHIFKSNKTSKSNQSFKRNDRSGFHTRIPYLHALHQQDPNIHCTTHQKHPKVICLCVIVLYLQRPITTHPPTISLKPPPPSRISLPGSGSKPSLQALLHTNRRIHAAAAATLLLSPSIQLSTTKTKTHKS